MKIIISPAKKMNVDTDSFEVTGVPETPYRLEMQAKLSANDCKNLYEFWGDRLYHSLVDDDRIIINLASKEYSQCIEKYITQKDR